MSVIRHLDVFPDWDLEGADFSELEGFSLMAFDLRDVWKDTDLSSLRLQVLSV